MPPFRSHRPPESRRYRLPSLALALLLCVTASASAANPPRPTSINQPLTDGCQRSPLPIGLDLSPEWVYVDRSPNIRMARGTVVGSHPSLEDSILQHRSFDYNGNLILDRRFRDLLAGDPTLHTNNFAPDSEEQGKLHV